MGYCVLGGVCFGFSISPSYSANQKQNIQPRRLILHSECMKGVIGLDAA